MLHSRYGTWLCKSVPTTSSNDDDDAATTTTTTNDASTTMLYAISNVLQSMFCISTATNVYRLSKNTKSTSCICSIAWYEFILNLFIQVCKPTNPANICLFKFTNRNTRKRCEICSKLTIKKPGRRQWHRSGNFLVNFEHISHLFLVFLLVTLN